MARRMTYEEKQAAREQREKDAELAQRRREIDEFKRERDEQRARCVYNDRSAWSTGLDIDGKTVTDRAAHRAAGALYDLVREFERVKDGLRTNVRRLQDRVTEMTARLNEGRTGSGYSTVLGDLPADIEQQNAKLDALVQAIGRISWATGWYVQEIHSAKQNGYRALLVSIDVVQYGDGFVVQSNGTDGTAMFLGHQGAGFNLMTADAVNLSSIIIYRDEDAAWFAAKTFVGDGRWL